MSPNKSIPMIDEDTIMEASSLNGKVRIIIELKCFNLFDA